MILTREDVHRQVWSAPMPKVARDLGLTAAELERLCKSLDVPFPYSGYWRKGAPLDGRPRGLPRARPGRPDAVELDLPPHASTPPSSPGPIVPAGPALGPPVDIDDAEDPVDRRRDLIRVRLAEALVRAGHTVGLGGAPRAFAVNGQVLTHWLREGYTRTKRPLTAEEARDPRTFARGRDYVFEERMTGRLILAVEVRSYGRKAEWRDHPRRGRLEDRIAEIVAGLEALADDTTRLRAEREAAEVRWRETEDRRRAAERRAQAEADRWSRLTQLAAQHEETRRVATFLKRLRAAAGPAAGSDPQLRAWFTWAQRALHAYDPLTWEMAEVIRQVDHPPRAWSIDDDAYEGLLVARDEGEDGVD